MQRLKPVTFSFDLEDHRAVRDTPGRYPMMTERVLDFLTRHDVRGTFFVLGEVAERDAQLVRTVHERGHEIAFHSYDHRPLTKDTPQRFRELTAKGKKLLEDITGDPVIGFRAPIFSLTPHSLWAVDVLRDLGFLYSSSVLPASNPMFGFPGAPLSPFQWPNGLYEFPVPIAHFGPLRIPYLGGIYLRYLPSMVTRRLRRNALQNESSNNIHWTYCHPYDFDAQEGYCRIRDASVPVSVALWRNRRASFRKLQDILKPEAGPPFMNLIEDGKLEGYPVFPTGPNE